jgi:hypothetical protein
LALPIKNDQDNVCARLARVLKRAENQPWRGKTVAARAVPGSGEGVDAGSAYAPELREEDKQQGVMRARETVHVQRPKLAYDKVKHGRLKSEVVDLLYLREIVRQLVLLPGNPLGDELDLVIIAEPEQAQTNFLQVLRFRAAALDQKEDVESIATGNYCIVTVGRVSTARLLGMCGNHG